MAANDKHATIVDDPADLDSILDSLKAGTSPFPEIGTLVEVVPIWGGRKLIVVWNETA